MIEIFDNTIPNNWTVVELDSLVNKIIGGGTPSRSNDAYYKGDIPWMTVKDMTSRRPGKISEHITLEAVANSSTNLIPPHTIIIATRMSLGKIVMLPFEVAINQDLKALIIPEHIDKYYVEHWFTSCSEYLKSLGTGTTVKGIRLEVLKKLSFPLPPLNEQKRIVTKIEALQTRSTAVKEELEAIKPLLNQFRQSVLAAAFRGDLTKDWRKQNPDVEPAEVLLERIRGDRNLLYKKECDKAKAEGKRKPKPFKQNVAEINYSLPIIPDTWKWDRFVNIANILGGVTKGRKFKDKKTIMLPYLRVANVQDGYLDLSEIKEIQVLPEDTQKYHLEYGDILVTEGGDRDKLGRGTIWQNEIENCIHQNHVYRARLYHSDLSFHYISLVLKSDIARKYFFNNASQTTNLASINITMLGNVPLAIPPKDEQQEIVRRIESLFKLADSIKQQYQQAEIDLETLNQSILAKAFRGELVPQDPNDEPASVLLERIKKERDKAKATAKKSKAKKKGSKKKDKQLGIPGM